GPPQGGAEGGGVDGDDGAQARRPVVVEDNLLVVFTCHAPEDVHADDCSWRLLFHSWPAPGPLPGSLPWTVSRSVGNNGGHGSFQPAPRLRTARVLSRARARPLGRLHPVGRGPADRLAVPAHLLPRSRFGERGSGPHVPGRGRARLRARSEEHPS